ncbi:porin [Roseospira marina]|nr:porin [Roseospira marina]MBB4314373.1 outer membrane protein OmpU [Roseospira marina]MBB5087533.1 outer membrane protein OmpU [Roseospira marina]
MKKVLFGTTALIAAASFAGTAQAEKIKLGIGGKQEVWFGVADVEDNADETYSSTGMSTDTELYFTGDTTLDNGITVRAVVQLEADQGGGDDADETYITMSGNFGALQLGNRQDVVANMVWIGEERTAQDWDEAFDWVPGFGDRYVYNYYSVDDTSIGYTTPSFFGFSGAASYTPDSRDRVGFGDWKTGSAKDMFAVGGAFDNEFSGIGVHADVGYWDQQGAGGAPDGSLIRGALALSYAGFTLGGSYGVQDYEGDDNAVNTWQIGASYVAESYAFDANYGQSETDDADDDVEADYVKVGAKYVLGPGVNLSASVFHANYDDDAAREDREVTGGLMGVALSF